MNSTLLAVHITVALTLTILLGVQCVELSWLRRSLATGNPRPVISKTAIRAIPVVTLIVAVTGGMLLHDGARGGAWIGAGVFSAVVIIATAVWTLRTLRNQDHQRSHAGAVGGHPMGSARVRSAAAYLMAARPETLVPALAPVLVAVLITTAAYLRTPRVRPVST